MRIAPTLIAIGVFFHLSSRGAEPTVVPEIAKVPQQEIVRLRKEADEFIRQFSTADSMEDYEQAFRTFFYRFVNTPADRAVAQQKARELGANAAVGQVELKHEIGRALKGAYFYAGFRQVGPRVLIFAYYRKHQFGPTPVVLVFNNKETNWSVSQVAMGAAARPDAEALWVHEPVAALKSKIPALPEMFQVTDQLMRVLTNQNLRATVERSLENFVPIDLQDTFYRNFVRTIERRPEAGASLGHELTGMARSSDQMCKLVYTWRFEQRFTPISFTFYKTDNRWLLSYVRLFDEALYDLRQCAVSTPADVP